MDSQTFPILENTDPVSSMIEYSQKIATGSGQGVGWTTPTLLNGWGSVAGYPVQYKRFGALVCIRGMLIVPASPNGKVAFTLPVGYRPGVNMFPGVAQGHASKQRTSIYLAGNGDFTPILNTTYISGTFNTGEYIPFHLTVGL